jgi:hypothetical protein
LIVMMLISFSTFSQTIKKDSVTISVAQAKKIAKDLAYLPVVIQEDSLLKIDTARFGFIIAQKDSIIQVKAQEINLLDTVVSNQKVQIELNAKEKKIDASQVKWLKVERVGLAILVIFVCGYAIGKP